MAADEFESQRILKCELGSVALRRTRWLLKHFNELIDDSRKRETDEYTYVALSDGTIAMHADTWVKVIKYIYENLDYTRREIMRLYFMEGKEWWKITAELNISRPIFYRGTNDIVYLTTIAAAQAGLVSI